MAHSSNPPRPRLACEITAESVIAARASEHGGSVEMHTIRMLPTGSVVPSLTATNVVEPAALANALADALQTVGGRSRDVTYSVAKLYFAYGLGNALYFPFAAGARTVLLSGPPAAPAVFDLVRHFKPTLFFAVPTWYANTLAADPELWSGADFSSVRVCVSAGEPLSGSI